MSNNGEELYKKYRPTTFGQMIGQREALATLADMGKRGAVPHCLLFTGPSGCLGGDSEIYDPVDGTTKTVRKRWEEGVQFHVLSLNEVGEVVIGVALAPERYPPVPMFFVETHQSAFYATGEHLLCLCDDSGYRSLQEIVDSSSPNVRLLSTLEFCQQVPRPGALHCSQRESDFLDDYPVCSYFYGEQLLVGGGAFLSSFALQTCVPRCIGCPGEFPRNHLSLYSDRLSRLGFCSHSPQYALTSSEFLSCEGNLTEFSPLCLADSSTVAGKVRRLYKGRRLRNLGPGLELAPDRGECLDSFCIRPLACKPPVVGMSPCGHTSIKNAVEIGSQEYFDFHVPFYENYWMGGIFHHNCGKTTAARILRNKLKCGDSDFVELNTADFRGIDMVRDIRSRMGLAPLNGEVRIWLIDEAGKLTSDAQDALLKMLEDTPSHVYFMLATTDPQKLKITIKTRCTEIKVRSLTADEIGTLLARVAGEEGISLHEDVAKKIADIVDGSARKALVLLHQVRGIAGPEGQLSVLASSDGGVQAIELARALMSGKTNWKTVADILKKLREMDADGAEGIRWMILGYATSVLLSSGVPTAALMVECFEKNFFDSKYAGLARACYDVVRLRK